MRPCLKAAPQTRDETEEFREIASEERETGLSNDGGAVLHGTLVLTDMAKPLTGFFVKCPLMTAVRLTIASVNWPRKTKPPHEYFAYASQKSCTRVRQTSMRAGNRHKEQDIHISSQRQSNYPIYP